MKAVVLILMSALLLPAETRQEKGRRIVDEALKTLGGDAFLKVKTRTEAGRAYSFYRDQLTGLAVAKVFTKYLDAPAGKQKLAVRERQSFGKEEDSVILFTEDGGYQVTYRGIRPMKDDRFERYAQTARNNFFYILRQRLQEPGLIFEFRESTRWSNIPVDVVDITDADNNTVSVYFQQSTKLPVRQVRTRRDPETKDRIEESSIWSKYRDVGGGVQWPFNIMAERNGEKVFELFSESVSLNDGTPESLFLLPKELKMLAPEK